MIYLIRANYANEFELQNYLPITKKLNINVITSHKALTKISLPNFQLWSPVDLPTFPYKRQLLNRLIGGEQWLFGLENLISAPSGESNFRNIAHTAETYTPYTHQAVQLRKKGVVSKLVCTCWETIPHNNEKLAIMRQWKMDAYKYVDLFHAPTESAKQALITEGVDQNKIVVIPYGVDLKRFQPRDLQGYALKGRSKTVLTVARLEIEKGMKDLEAVAKSLPQYDFLVIGSGSYHLRGDNIKTSSVSYSQIHTHYQQADLFFLPSRTTNTWEEQYGMALVEAMASGLPIVTTRCGSIPEVVGPAGVILDEGDTTSMVKSIRGLLSNLQSLNEARTLSRSRACKYFDSRQTSSKLAELYK